MTLKPNAAEIVAALPPRERWRLHHRYLRERAKWLAEASIGDPLGFVAILRKDGILADLQTAIMLTKPRMRPHAGEEIRSRPGGGGNLRFCYRGRERCLGCRITYQVLPKLIQKNYS
jgi:hypothetical protein